MVRTSEASCRRLPRVHVVDVGQAHHHKHDGQGQVQQRSKGGVDARLVQVQVGDGCAVAEGQRTCQLQLDHYGPGKRRGCRVGARFSAAERRGA